MLAKISIQKVIFAPKYVHSLGATALKHSIRIRRVRQVTACN